MTLWQWWKETTYNLVGNTKDKQNVTFPESKEKITKEAIEQKLANISDATIDEITVLKQKASLIYIKTLTKYTVIQNLIIKPLHDSQNNVSVKDILPFAESVQENDLPNLIHDLMSGYTVLLFLEPLTIFKVNTFNITERSITTAENETTVLGPQDAFIESLDTNLSLIRKRIVSSNLKCQQMILGTETGTSIAVVYMEDIANPQLIDDVVTRLKNIEYQGFLSMSQLNAMIEDFPYSPFPQLGATQRPDNVVAALLDGRVVIFMNGSPEATICPTTFLELFISPEDFYTRWTAATLLRFLRFFGFFISVLLTSTYVSVLTYHQEMLPPELLLLLSESRSKVPFPPLIEVLFIELVIEILREAGARMPTKIGQTIGIVGGIVIGTAAVDAGLASNVLIVLVSISALLSFLPASYLLSSTGRFIRYFFIIAGGLFGIYGQMLALTSLLAHLLKLTSFNQSYMSPVLPLRWTDLQNSILRAPAKFLLARSSTSRAKKNMRRPVDEE